MSCKGCAGDHAAGGYTKSRTGTLVLNDVMTAAAMCESCPHSWLESCTVDGKPLVNHAHAIDCPKGRHPKNGVVTWLWVRWYGVPLPLRVLIFRFGLPGCGCIKFLRYLI